ncbi:leucyl aminopeptidase [Hoyosella rhizosphaerae]|uniref:Probable cytosol aminopeptidase n=1 Tax=Hoyosella rhizosphaerae TaxID=1755582 RepID=A0A916UGJ5_9ACTN|nr:leucyl aminopeptidase [Hoyosella rhizosphaerae]MBN4927971.1 leucyl aminopeptidase [Hoyosella rhizosphaerae]GGC71359.1 putative cytosol aminopeptidase [Hoyosella rhizosphaerae]
MSAGAIAQTKRLHVEFAAKVTKAHDVVVVGVLQGGKNISLDGVKDLWDKETRAAVVKALKEAGATGKRDQFTRVPSPKGVAAGSVVGVGLGVGKQGSLTAEELRRISGSVARSLTGVRAAATTLHSRDLASVVEGFILGSYSFSAFKSAKTAPAKDALPLAQLDLVATGSGDGKAKSQLKRSIAVAEAVSLARDFVNTPPSHLYPEVFADHAASLATDAGLEVEILDETQLDEGGYGGIYAVGKGSARKPRLVRIAHRGGGEEGKTVALVGKGVTFDTGGISIKPAAGMENMTSDMGGAAAVIATVLLAAKLDLPINVIATVPMAENMPSANATRPGDVITHYGGTTVEVINTDAEGRLILADALGRAAEDNPDYIIDTATLTGAQMVALGTRVPGVMGTDEFRDRVAWLSQEIGENAWAMPMPQELRADLNSKVADLANVTNHRWGGMLSAALFLKEFVANGTPWAHIDVAGPAYNTGGPWGYTGKGGTGVPVRTMLAVLEDVAANG